MRFNISANLTYQFAGPSEVLLLLEAATGGDQTVSAESLIISHNPRVTRLDDPSSGERRLVFLANGTIDVRYQADRASRSLASLI